MKKEKVKNQNGDISSDSPSEKLIIPPEKAGSATDRSTKNNTTAKDPHLGNRSSAIR